MATPKKPNNPRVLISGTVTTTPGTRLGIKPKRAPSITEGRAIAATPKIADKAGKVGAAMQAKVKKAEAAAKAARGNLMIVKAAKKMGIIQPTSAANRALQESTQRSLDTGRTAARGKMQTNNALRAKKK